MTLPIRWTMSSVGILGLQGIPVLMKRVGSRWFTFLIDVFLPQTRVWRNKPGKQNYEMDMETQRSTKNPTHKEHQQRRDPDPISEVEWQLRQLGIWSMVVGAEIASGFFRPHAQNKRTDQVRSGQACTPNWRAFFGRRRKRHLLYMVSCTK